jgi:hypothetical protein
VRLYQVEPEDSCVVVGEGELGRRVRDYQYLALTITSEWVPMFDAIARRAINLLPLRRRSLLKPALSDYVRHSAQGLSNCRESSCQGGDKYRSRFAVRDERTSVIIARRLLRGIVHV